MLQALPRYDSKWMKTNFQAAFTEEGLSKLWNELAKDGEIVTGGGGVAGGSPGSNKEKKEEEGEGGGERSSQFKSFLEEWTWGQEPTAEHLQEALQVLVAEQQDLSHQAAQSMLSLSRLGQRLVVLERCCIALHRKGLSLGAAGEGGHEGEEAEGEKSEVDAKESETKKEQAKGRSEKMGRVTKPGTNMATEGLAKVGARAALSFAFAFLKRAWRSGEDSDLCTDVLEQALSILQELPVALLFDTSSLSGVWVDVVDRTMFFLAEVCQGLKIKGIPLHDRQTALALLLELTLQRGTLQHLLDAVLLLLQLSEVTGSTHKGEDGKQPPDYDDYPPSNEDEQNFPLVPFLRRLGDIQTPLSPYAGFQKPDMPPDTASPTKRYLEFLTLPNDDSTRVDLRQVATVTLSHLDRLVEPYSVLEVPHDSSDSLPCKVIHWGGGKKKSSLLTGPRSSEVLVELGTKQIVASDKHKLILTVHGSVYSIQDRDSGEIAATPVAFPGDVEITQLALHPEGKHFLALSQTREVYAWGSGENGQLGLEGVKSQETPALIPTLSGKNVVFIAAGGSHSAATTEGGALYTWGRGSFGRLGHGNAEDKNVPTLVQALVGHKIIDVDCGSGDAHTLALEDNGHMWSWGDGDFGKLGRGGSDGCKSPKLIADFDVEVAKVLCGMQFSLALSRDGRVFTWGSSGSHCLGHGKEDHVGQPKQVEALANHCVVEVATGTSHCLALTAAGEVFGWGKMPAGEAESESVREAVAVPTLIPEASGQGVVYISCGAQESFACCRHQVVSLGSRLPFCLDVEAATFEKLDLLLRSVCDGLDGSRGAYPPPRQDQECLAISTLNLLRLQLHTATMEHLSSEKLGLAPGSLLLSSLKRYVVGLAKNPDVLASVQQAAQAVLKSGWMILLPTVSERASALSELLPTGDASLSEDSLLAGHQFMIDLLISSLMADCGLESALAAAIACESQDPASLLKPGGGVARVEEEAQSTMPLPLLQLVQQLISTSTSKQIAHLKKLLELVNTVESEAEPGGDSAPIDLLLLFQRLLLTFIHSRAAKEAATEEGRGYSAQTHGAVSLLLKYIAMLHEHTSQVLPSACQVAATIPKHFSLVTGVITKGPMGTLLPELSIGLVLLQLRAPVLLVESQCVPVLGELVAPLDRFCRLAPGAQKEDEEDLAWAGVKRVLVGDSNSRVLSQEDIDNHNKDEDGCWVVIHGKVYDLKPLSLQAPCGGERLLGCAGQDVTKAFETSGHSDFAREMAKQFLVGDYREAESANNFRDSTQVSPILIDLERTLALLQGLRACFMVQSIPVLPEEEESEKWLQLEIFSSGYEHQPVSSYLGNRPGPLSRTFDRQLSFDGSRSFICGLMNPEIQDEKVTRFLALVHQYCVQRNLVIMLCDHNKDHPVEKFGRLFMACLLKVNELVPAALSIVEQEGSPNNEQESVQLPASLADICKLVYDAKVSLIKTHQESSCSYEEVCRDPIARCVFMIDNIRSPMLNVVNILHKSRIQGTPSRWQKYGQQVLHWKRAGSQRSKGGSESASDEGSLTSRMRAKAFHQQLSVEVKQQKESGWDQVNLEIASSRKFKWLRERMGGSSPHTTLLNQIKHFILTDEVNLRALHSTLKRQVNRATLRLNGVRFLQSVLTQDQLLPSVKYSILCGWLGLVGQPSSVSKPHYLASVERIPPALQTLLELEFHAVERWAVERLRAAVWEVELALSQSSHQPCKTDAEKSNSDASASPKQFTVGTYSSSRFIIASLAMISTEFKAVDLSLLLNHGLLGLSQTVLRHAGSPQQFHTSTATSSSPLAASSPHSTNFNGVEVVKRMAVGTRVVRGPDWKWGDQDGNPPQEGRVINEVGSDGWVRVQWDTGTVNSYRMGKEDKYDLDLAPSELLPKTGGEESKEEPEDSKLTTGMPQPLLAEDLPSDLILRSTVCLLRSVVVAVGIHSKHLHRRNTASLASLLHHIVHCGNNKDARNQSLFCAVAAAQHDAWTTLGFLRGVSTPPLSGRALCSPPWIQLMMGIIKSASPLCSQRPAPHSLPQQVLTLRLLRAVLPSWEPGSNISEQEQLVQRLFQLLGEVLVLCSSPFIRPSKPGKGRKHKKVRLHASLTASDNSTIAEEIVVLLRRLHPLEAWNPLINDYISSSLQSIPSLITRSPTFLMSVGGDARSKDQQLAEDVNTHGAVLAVLMVIGGLDTRPRLGGLVEHEELGVGTIAKVEGKSRVVVLFHGRKVVKLCSIGSIKPLPVLRFRVDHLPMSQTVMGIWSSLVRLAGTGGAATSSSALPSTPSRLSTLTQSLQPSKPIQPPKKEEADDSINIPLLRQQQIRLGLLKAARVLFSQQENLRQIMARPAEPIGDEGEYSLFQQLLGAATRPSPIKAMFGRDELEAAAVSVCQYLASEVHKPFVAPLPATQPEPQPPPMKKKPAAVKKTTPPQKPKAKSSEPPPPSALVSQIMEMGFERRHIEYAIQVTQNNNPDRLVGWLLDHTHLEVPELESPPTPSVPDPPMAEAPPQAAEDDVTGADSSSESSEYMEEVEEEEEEPPEAAGQQRYKTRDSFADVDGYARYVKENIAPGVMVRCCEAYEEVRLGDTGRVIKVDNDGLHDLNVQANWQQKGGSYWVRFANCELLATETAGMTTFKQGDKVRVKRSVSTPKYKWGSVTHQSVGAVRAINRNGTDVCVDFPEQSNWTGLITEMELVPGIHPRHSCNGCSMHPLEGPRYHCQVCADFDFCQNCFDRGQAHNHAFERIDDQGQAAVFVGSPRSRRKALKRRKKKMMHGGSVVMDWDQIVRHLSVSSNESLSYRLIDGSHSTYWQSSGPQGKHWVRLELQRNILVEQLALQVEPSDSSYMPSLVAVLAGSTVGGLRELKQCSIPAATREFVLLTGVAEYYPIIEIAVRACKSGGIDTKVHGVSIIGRVDMNEDEVAANFTFLTFEDASKDTSLVRKQRKKTETSLDSHTNKVFVWGLNDRTQLGSGVSETKVKAPFESKTLARLRPVQLIGGSKTLFIVSQDGKVYGCGEGTNGRLGVGGFADVSAPKPLMELSTYVVRKVAVSTGGRHAMALTADGKVFSWGDGEYGQLGHGDNKSYDSPKMVEGLQGKHVRDIACGSGHSAAITSNGELYTWGQGDHGRLGHGDTLNQSKPKQVRTLEKFRVACVACGSRDAQTLAATENGTLWSWGDGSFGKLGQGDVTSSNVPEKVMDLSSLGLGSVGVTQLECGAQFSVMLTKDGKVYTWGKGDYYRLGTDSNAHVRKPQLVESFNNSKVVQIAVGSLHCLALTESGEVYAWGDNDHGQQGNGSTICNHKPQQVMSLKDHRITKIACGSSHSIAFATGTPPTAGEFTPISFPTTQDSLGTLLTSGKPSEDTHELDEAKRPSLTKVVLSLTSPAKQQESLGYIQTALQIAYARDAIVNSLGGFALAVQESEEAENDAGASVEITGIIPPSPDSGTGLAGSLGLGVKCKGSEVAVKKPTFISAPAGLDDFTGLLTVEDARVMVDLLKLAVANRVGEKGRETLAAVLTAMGKASPEVSTMLMGLCISELEDVAREPMLSETPQSVVQESPHPYPDDFTMTNTVRMPGAEAVIVTFDSSHCSTERRHDVLVIKDGGGAIISTRSGRDAADWAQDIRVIGDELAWTFKSDGSVNGWGFRFTVQPLMPKKLHGGTLLSDRMLQSRPSIDLVTCLLDFQLGRSPSYESISRLGAALASCAQLNALDASQRMWAVQHLRKLINSRISSFLVSGAMGTCCPMKQSSSGLSSMCSLVRRLPDLLLKQYNYEMTHVTGGSQLLHSPFFGSLVALACDLELESMDCCNDSTKWAWFTQYCMAARMVKALQNRTPIPPKCLVDVNERIDSLKPAEEPDTREHENHELFKQDHDEQLLLWTQRYPKDWSIPLGNSFSVYGWGHNHRGQLGGVEGNKVKVPRLCESFSELNPVQIIGGEQTLFAVTQDGKVYASGYAAYGRLGVGGNENVSSPTAISFLASRGVVVKKLAVHSGGKHCLAVTATGELYSWGEGDDGKLGLGGTANMDTPHLVESLKDKKVVDAACGSSHSAAIIEGGALFTWGKGRYGRLGHNDHEPQYKPRQLMALKGENVTCVACGSGDAQTLCATASGNVYSWGDGDYGKLGRGGNEGCKTPKKVDALTGKGVKKMLCGSQFSMALTDKGHVYTWGKGDYYRLGHGDDAHQRIPKRVMGALATEKVVDIACGSLHCVVCTEAGKVYSWGDNDEGQIGNDTTSAIQGPQLVKLSDEILVDHVACGSAHSLAWSSVRRKVACRLPEKVPMEFNHLQGIQMPVLRNRLILLHNFSNLFCRSLTLFSLQSKHSEGCSHEGPFEGFDRLRTILLSGSKESAFKRIIKATMSQGKQHGPVIELNRIQVKRSRSRGGLAGTDGLKSVFGQMCSKWHVISQEDLLLPHRVWKVKFVGESVDDCGGGYSESIAEMCDELQNGSVPLLIQTPNGREDTGVNRDCFIVNPAASSSVHLNMFRFLGALMAIAVRTGSPINLNLAPPVWKQLVGMSLTLSDLSEIDSDYVQGLLYVRDNPEAFIGIDFTAPSAGGKEVHLHPTWTLVTAGNCQEYVRLSTFMRLHEFDPQVQAMREGLAKVIPVPLLALFTGPELETMVCGSQEISISLLKSVTTYKGIEPTAPLVRWFWEVMENFNQTERSLFLRFVWGRTRLPRTAADFRGRDFVLQVLDKYHPPDYYLPESYTCFFLLKIPRYSCKPVLEEKLCYAINFCKSIDTDDYARINLQEGLLMDDEDDDIIPGESPP